MPDYTTLTEADARRAVGELIAAVDDIVEAWEHGDLAENVNAAEALADYYRHEDAADVCAQCGAAEWDGERSTHATLGHPFTWQLAEEDTHA